MKKFGGLFLLVMLLALPSLSSATLVDDRTFSGADCGSDCFGLTYHLTVNDGQSPGEYTATLTITGIYTGSMAYIGAVDIKVGEASSSPTPTLLAAPGPESEWTTFWQDGQAANNCQNGSGKFLCSYDIGENTLAQVANGGVVNYEWSWNFSLDGAYTFGHLGANFTDSIDGCLIAKAGQTQEYDTCQDGQNISISGGSNHQVPEPGTFILLGGGLIALGFVARKRLVRR